MLKKSDVVALNQSRILHPCNVEKETATNTLRHRKKIQDSRLGIIGLHFV